MLKKENGNTFLDFCVRGGISEQAMNPSCADLLKASGISAALVVNGVFSLFGMDHGGLFPNVLKNGAIRAFGKIYLRTSCPDHEFTMIDATIVRAHACSAGYGKNTQDSQALGRSKGGLTTKSHALVDALGNPLKFILTSGQRHEITQAPALIQVMENTWVSADKGYDSNAFVEELEKKGLSLLFPPKKTENIPELMMNISLRNDTLWNVSLVK